MDRHGSPKLIGLQPASTDDRDVINSWLSIFSVISKADDGMELRIRYRTGDGEEVTAFIVPGDSMMDIGLEGNDISLYMYARDIIKDKTRRI